MPPAKKESDGVEIQELKSYSHKGQTLLTVDFNDKERPGTVRVARCSADMLEALGKACQHAAAAIKKN